MLADGLSGDCTKKHLHLAVTGLSKKILRHWMQKLIYRAFLLRAVRWFLRKRGL